jgi:hypothetical protein
MSWFKYSFTRICNIPNDEVMDNSIKSVFNPRQRTCRLGHLGHLRWKLSNYVFNHFNSKEWINYCGIFYFFIKSIEAKQQHYNKDIKPIFTSWSRVTIEPIQYHYGCESLFIKHVIGSITDTDPDNMGRDHLTGYKKWDNSSFDALKRSIDKYNQRVRNLIDEWTSRIKLDINAHVPTIVEYDNVTKVKINYYSFHNVRDYLWTKFWEEKPKTTLSIINEGSNYVLASSESPNRLAISDNEWDLKQLKEYLDGTTDEYANSLKEIESERKKVVSEFDAFKQVIKRIMRDLSWNRLLRGKCGWERGFLSLR